MNSLDAYRRKMKDRRGTRAVIKFLLAISSNSTLVTKLKYCVVSEDVYLYNYQETSQSQSVLRKRREKRSHAAREKSKSIENLCKTCELAEYVILVSIYLTQVGETEAVETAGDLWS